MKKLLVALALLVSFSSQADVIKYHCQGLSHKGKDFKIIWNQDHNLVSIGAKKIHYTDDEVILRDNGETELSIFHNEDDGIDIYFTFFKSFIVSEDGKAEAAFNIDSKKDHYTFSLKKGDMFIGGWCQEEGI